MKFENGSNVIILTSPDHICNILGWRFSNFCHQLSLPLFVIPFLLASSEQDIAAECVININGLCLELTVYTAALNYVHWLAKCKRVGHPSSLFVVTNGF